MMHNIIILLNTSILSLFSNICLAQEFSLHFLGSGSSSLPDIDRVVIPLDNPERPVDVGMDFTIEFWMKAVPGDNPAGGCGPDQWYYGNVIIDRDVFGDGDHGDYGIVICNRRVVAGVQRGSLGHGGVEGTTIVDDGIWHHVAVTREASTGGVRLYVDGTLDAMSMSSPSTGNIGYKNGRSTSYPDDPTLVFGAEKHDYPGSLYYKGKLDEIRISNIRRYNSNFVRPVAPFTTDGNTMALYRFNEGNGTTLLDVSGAFDGPSNGTILYGGNPVGPVWSFDSPFYPAIEVTTIADDGAGSFRQAVTNAVEGSNIVFSPYLSGQTISINSPIVINKSLMVKDMNTNKVTLRINGTGPVLNILSGITVQLKSLNIISGSSGTGKAIYNEGNLRLENVMINDIVPNIGISIYNQGNLEIVDNVTIKH